MAGGRDGKAAHVDRRAGVVAAARFAHRRRARAVWRASNRPRRPRHSPTSIDETNADWFNLPNGRTSRRSGERRDRRTPMPDIKATPWLAKAFWVAACVNVMLV